MKNYIVLLEEDSLKNVAGGITNPAGILNVRSGEVMPKEAFPHLLEHAPIDGDPFKLQYFS